MKRKGITPVIAVVLLLLITVGAVAGAWQTYQSLIANQDQQEQLAAQRKASNTDIDFASVYNSSDGTIQMSIRNTGQRAINVSKEFSLYVIPPGSQGRLDYDTFTTSSRTSNLVKSSVTYTCFQLGDGLLKTGETYQCETQIKFPKATQEIGLVIDYNAVANHYWAYTCSPQTSSTITC
ncbi:MAG: archaellin/type IV pilin N-terminal domain-containing protein [Candidatus Nanohaloarchaea archaeon]